jgi:hypothetical protein
MLKRLVELNNKISKLELDFTTLSEKQYFTYDDEELDDEELVKDELVKDELVKDELVKDELVKDELVKDEVFEIIDATTNTPVIVASKKSGWFSF